MIKKIIKFLISKKIQEYIQRLLRQGSVFKGLVQGYGQWKTIRDCSSVDKSGAPIPWYTYPTTEFLSHLDLSRFKVFEYGSGNSTLWWAARSKQVTSIEDDELWYEKIKCSLKGKNVEYRLEKSPHKYFAMATNDFDVFIVDGKYRHECLKHIVNLKKTVEKKRGGHNGIMLILDNSDWYPNTVRFLQEKLGWMQIDFHGYGPINDYTWTTSIFVNPKKYSELCYFRALKSQCSIQVVADDDN
jgi:hypothetical protein